MFSRIKRRCSTATLLVHPNDHPQDSDLVEMNERNEIVAFHSYPHAADANLQNLVNAALYVFSKRALRDSGQVPERSWGTAAVARPRLAACEL